MFHICDALEENNNKYIEDNIMEIMSREINLIDSITKK